MVHTSLAMALVDDCSLSYSMKAKAENWVTLGFFLLTRFRFMTSPYFENRS